MAAPCVSPAFLLTASRASSWIGTISVFTAVDERLGVQSFYEGQEFLYDLVKILSTSGVTESC